MRPLRAGDRSRAWGPNRGQRGQQERPRGVDGEVWGSRGVEGRTGLRGRRAPARPPPARRPGSRRLEAAAPAERGSAVALGGSAPLAEEPAGPSRPAAATAIDSGRPGVSSLSADFPQRGHSPWDTVLGFSFVFTPLLKL